MSDVSILPLGSVVRLESTDALAMIIGYEPIVGDGKADYMGVAYPMGLVSEDSAIAFDRSSIGDVMFTGYLDEEGRDIFAAIRTYRQATQDMLDQVNRFIETLTPERVQELRSQHAPVEMPEDFQIPEGFEDIVIE